MKKSTPAKSNFDFIPMVLPYYEVDFHQISPKTFLKHSEHFINCMLYTFLHKQKSFSHGQNWTTLKKTATLSKMASRVFAQFY